MPGRQSKVALLPAEAFTRRSATSGWCTVGSSGSIVVLVYYIFLYRKPLVVNTYTENRSKLGWKN